MLGLCVESRSAQYYPTRVVYNVGRFHNVIMLNGRPGFQDYQLIIQLVFIKNVLYMF